MVHRYIGREGNEYLILGNENIFRMIVAYLQNDTNSIDSVPPYFFVPPFGVVQTIATCQWPFLPPTRIIYSLFCNVLICF
jgi:hypothetical protein